MYIHNTDIYLKPEHRDDYVRLLIEEVRLAKRLEPNLKRFDIMQNLADPNLIHTIEVYADKAAWEFHHQQPYLLEFMRRTADWYSVEKETRLSEARNVEPPDGEWT